MKNKIFKLGLVISGTALFLTGCVQRDSHGNPYGFIYDTLAVPTQHILNYLSSIFGNAGNSYGWAIIAITFIARLLLMPIMIRQSKNATIQQERMASVKPQMAAIQKRQKEATTQEEKTAISQELMQLYKDNNISVTGGIGCLPILIQMPIFAALYAAIQYSTKLSGSDFYGINLGQRNLFLVALTFAIYAFQGWLSMQGQNLSEDQAKQMRTMMLISPIMLGVMTYSSPAGLGLYFAVGGVFACIQTLIINAMRPSIRKQIENEIKLNKPKINSKKKEVPLNKDEYTLKAKENNSLAKKIHEDNLKFNAGKQNNLKK